MANFSEVTIQTHLGTSRQPGWNQFSVVSVESGPEGPAVLCGPTSHERCQAWLSREGYSYVRGSDPERYQK